MTKSIEELVMLAQQEDQSAIAALYEQTYNSVYQSVRAIIKDEDEALDIVQDSYIKGFRNLDKLGDPQKYQAWMKTIAANQARDFLRKKRPVLFSERIDEDGEEIDLRHQDDCLAHMPEEVIDRQETTRLMNDILGTLKQEQRLAVVMYYYEEMSIREIAEALECSENTVKSRLKYARDKIEAEVRKLEKKGTKLYSMAPMSFFTWLLRLAKEQGFTFVMDGMDALLAAGTAATAGEATATVGTATAAGETTAASAASGKAAAGAAAKTATSAAGKSVATKVVAGTLAVTMAAGAVAVSNLSREKENEAAHVVYEEFLGRYNAALGMEWDIIYADINQFWNEVSSDILEQNPEVDLTKTVSWNLEYIPEEDLGDGIPVPDTVYDVNMNRMTLLTSKIEDESVRYAYYDVNNDGIDEMFISMFYRGEMVWQNHLGIYAVEDGKLYRGAVDQVTLGPDNQLWKTWKLTTGYEADYVAPGVVYINYGKGYFDAPIEIEEPELVWQILRDW